jgi:diguanylate cyclase (GGDEF)-like protein/PAS domain S-box-containing protein
LSQEPSTAQTDRTVLVVDDDATIRRIIRRALEKDDWAVEEADNGLAAGAAVERCRPDLVLLDVEMPELNGYDTCARLRTLPGGEKLPILMITGRDDKQSIAEAYRTGATDFLSKPFDYTVLRQRVQYMYRASQALGQLQSERDFVSATFDASAALVLSLDADGRILRFNPSCERASGLSLKDVQHRFFWDIFSDAEEGEQERLMFERLVCERNTKHNEGSWTATDGTRREIAWSNAVCVGSDGKLEQVVCTGLDITERNQAQDEVRFLASYDPLTGLPNRRLMLERVDQAIAAADADGQQLAVLLLDLDRFTHVNATVGHAVGDLLLRDVSQRLSKSLRLSDVLARHSRDLRTELGRIGGHEFTVLLTGVSRPKEVVGVIERLQRGLDRPFRCEEREYALTASVGATLYPSDGTDAEGLLRNAESAMEAARRQRPGSYHFYSASMRTSISHRLSLESELRYAIGRGELVLHYQPKVDAATRSLVGAEALVRWQHPDRGLVPPADFIDIAEETGLILPIGEWVLREACTQVMDWLESGLRAVPVAVNLSSAQFHLEDLLGQMVSVLNDTGMDPRYLGIEVTESMIMRDAGEAHAILDRLKMLGVRVAIDDFGTGYSALSAIKTLPFHDLKIDRVFIKDIAEIGEDLAIAKAIITMAHGLGLKVVAEGVESEEQLTILHQEGCDEVQGFLISPAVPSDQFAAMLHDRDLVASSAAPSLAGPGGTETPELVRASGSTTVRDLQRRSP